MIFEQVDANVHFKALNGLIVAAMMIGVIIVFVVAAIVLYLLRRPLFGLKKKQEPLELEPEVIVSGPPALDQFAVAMNTGIFLPAQGYDLQGCNFQEIPIVGSTVFKPVSRSTSPAPSPAHTARKVNSDLFASNLKDPSLAHMRSANSTSSPLNSRRSSSMSTSTTLSARAHEVPPTPPRSPGPPHYDALEPPAYEEATGPSSTN